MSDEQLSPFERRLMEKKKALGQLDSAPTTPEFDHSEFVPDIELTTSPEDDELDRAIKALDIVYAYAKWCGKSKPHAHGSQKEGIKVSCPNPAHPDTNPSAWLNNERNLWYCSGCAQGGDVWDIAAWHFGFHVPQYKKNADQFRELREKMGTDLGFSVIRGTTQTFIVPPRPDEDEDNNVRVLPSAVEEQQAVEAHAASVADSDTAVIDWRTILPESTFLKKWMEATSVDVCPEEFHFWMGLMAIGFAVGRNRVLNDFKPVVPNLFVCLVGPSGAKKSQAKGYLSDVIDLVMPYEYGNPLSTGTKDVNSPGSAEYIVKTFSEPIPDPTDPKKIIGYGAVRALIQFDELSTLMGMSSRVGSIMKPQLLEIYDSAKVIGSGSLTHGSRVAKMPFGQVVSSTQNDSITKLLAKSDDASGFMNRWVFASGKHKTQVSIGGVRVDIAVPAEYLKQIRVWAGSGKDMYLTEEAYAKFDAFFHGTMVPLKTISEKNGSAILTRVDLLMKKLMILFACNMREDEITVEAVDQAIALWPYLLQTYGVVTKQMERTVEGDITERIIDAVRKTIEANGRGASSNDVYKILKRHATASEIKRQLTDLGGLGVLIEEPVPANKGRGRPAGTRWLLNESA